MAALGISVLIFLVLQVGFAFVFQLAFNCLAPLFHGPTLTYAQAFAATFLLGVVGNLLRARGK